MKESKIRYYRSAILRDARIERYPFGLTYVRMQVIPIPGNTAFRDANTHSNKGFDPERSHANTAIMLYRLRVYKRENQGNFKSKLR